MDREIGRGDHLDATSARLYEELRYIAGFNDRL